MSSTFNIDCLQPTLYVNLCKSTNPVLLTCCLFMQSNILIKRICNKHDVPLFANANRA